MLWLCTQAPEFEKLRAAVVASKREKYKTLYEEAQSRWTQISTRALDFDRKRTDAAVIEDLGQADIVAFFDKYFLVNSPDRAKLSIQVASSLLKDNPEQEKEQEHEKEKEKETTQGQAEEKKGSKTESGEKGSENLDDLEPAPADLAETTTLKVGDLASFRGSSSLFPNPYYRNLNL